MNILVRLRKVIQVNAIGILLGLSFIILEVFINPSGPTLQGETRTTIESLVSLYPSSSFLLSQNEGLDDTRVLTNQKEKILLEIFMRVYVHSTPPWMGENILMGALIRDLFIAPLL